MDQIWRALLHQVRQRRRQLLLREACVEQIVWRDDRTKTVANRMHCHEQMVEAIASFHNLVVYGNNISHASHWPGRVAAVIRRWRMTSVGRVTGKRTRSDGDEMTVNRSSNNGSVACSRDSMYGACLL